MITFYLIRHGETDWNIECRFQGRENIPLNDTGIRQAEECGRGLKETKLPFDCIISSPLDRAFRTAQSIAGELGIPFIHRDEGLIERDFGKVSGRKREERELMLASGEDLQIEEEALVAKRMRQVLERFCDGTYQHVIVVSHGASIRALLSEYCEAGSAPATEVQGNAAVSTLIYDAGRFYLEAFDKRPEELTAWQNSEA